MDCRRRPRARILQVKILPVAGGVTLLWHDVTERTRAEHELKRSEERLALAAEGANDGLWEWDLRTAGVLRLGPVARDDRPAPPTPASGAPEDWLDRVHPTTSAPLKEALDAHLSGETEHFQHEHRIRHEDGTYRLVPVPRRRGATAPAGGRPASPDR